MKKLLFIAILLLTTNTAWAQGFKLTGVHAGVECGDNNTDGTFVRASAGMAVYYGRWSTSLSAAYSSSDIAAVDLRQNYALGSLKGFTVSGRLLWRNPYGCNELVTAFYVGRYSDAWQFELGWSGRFGGLAEPMNLYYSATWLPLHNNRWTLSVGVSSHEEFIIERSHSPFFVVGCIYSPTENLHLKAAAVLHEAGMFNLAAEYYEAYMKLGVEWLW